LFSGEAERESLARDARLARERPLAYYARFFDAVEVDASFYRIPSRETVAKWVETTERAGPRPFLFSMKLPRTLTHEAVLHLDDLPPFSRAIEPLVRSGRLAALLAQFPQSFHRDDGALERIERLREALPDLPLAIEVRHVSWGEDGGLDGWLR